MEGSDDDFSDFELDKDDAVLDRDEAIMLKMLLVILFRTSQNVFPLFSSFSLIIPKKKILFHIYSTYK